MSGEASLGSVSVRELCWKAVKPDDFQVCSSSGAAYDVVLGTYLVDAGDRLPDEEPFAALGHLLREMQLRAPSCLGLLVFEERGPPKLEALGSIFAPLAREGELWEYRPPTRLGLSLGTGNRLRYLCIRGVKDQVCESFDGWRALLAADEDCMRQWRE